jgi:hypothetical protein
MCTYPLRDEDALVTAAQKLVKKIPVSVSPKRDLQVRWGVNFAVTGKNILCFDELSTKILAAPHITSILSRVFAMITDLKPLQLLRQKTEGR